MPLGRRLPGSIESRRYPHVRHLPGHRPHQIDDIGVDAPAVLTRAVLAHPQSRVILARPANDEIETVTLQAHDDLLNQHAHDPFARRNGRTFRVPGALDVRAEPHERLPLIFGHALGRRGAECFEFVLKPSSLLQALVPTSLEFVRHQPVVGIDGVILPSSVHGLETRLLERQLDLSALLGVLASTFLKSRQRRFDAERLDTLDDLGGDCGVDAETAETDAALRPVVEECAPAVIARDDRKFVVLPIIRPQRMAISGETGLLRALEGAFGAAKLSVARADLRATIEGGAAKLRALMSLLAQKKTPAASDPAGTPKAPTLVLSIDQSEELFLAEGQREAQPFLALLRDLVTADAPAVIALFTIRSDNYERLQLAGELEGVRQQTLSLPPMPKGSYAEVVKGPARRLEGTSRALRIDDAVVEALLADVEAGSAKDALPLLAFTLERLYSEYGATGRLKVEHYEKLGRIEGSIEAAVERAFRAADTDPKVPKDKQAQLALLRRGLIPCLAGIDPDTGAPRRRIARLSEIPAEARSLIDLLIEQRLLSTDVATGTKETTIEPAHEALLRQWGLLRGWLAEDSGLLGVLEGVKRASRDWAANAKSPAWLTHTTGRLEAAERLRQRADLEASLKPTDNDYLDACRFAEQLTSLSGGYSG